MKQIILAIAILMLALTASAQQRDENNTLNRRQENLLQPVTTIQTTGEVGISEAVLIFN